MFRNLSKIVAIIVLAITASGCAINQHQQAGSGSVEFGVVMHAEKASVASRNQEIGMAALGGVLGSAIGVAMSKDKSWSSRTAAISVGSSVGAMVGNVAAKAVGATEGQSLIVLNGDLKKLSITQPIINGAILNAGDAVYIIRESGGVRAVRIKPGDPVGTAFVAGLQGLPRN